MPSLNLWLLASLTVMSAGTIQSLTGFGFGLVSVPFLLMLFPSRQAVLTHFKRLVFSLLLVVGLTSAWDAFRLFWR